MRLEGEWNWSRSGVSDEFVIKLSLGVSSNDSTLGTQGNVKFVFDLVRVEEDEGRERED